MSHSSTLKSRIIARAEIVIPTEFYDVREETHPKAGWVPMYSFTSLVYIAAVIAFTLLYVNEKQKATMETIITSYDNTGHDGYTCQMISFVTASYQIPVTIDPSLAYNLVNVMESATECENNLLEASPCNQPLTFFPGAAPASIQLDASTNFGAVAMFGDKMSFIWVEPFQAQPYLLSYNYSDGSLGSYYYDFPDYVSPASLAVDTNGNVVYIATLEHSAQVFRSKPNTVGYDTLYNTEQHDIPFILNDNLYSIYMIQNNSFVALDIYSTPVVSTVLFNVSADDNILYAAVYNDGVSPLVYYSTSLHPEDLCVFQSGVSTCSTWEDGSTIKGLSVDGMNQLYVMLFRQLGNGVYFIVNEGSFWSFISEAALPPTGFGVSPAGERIMVGLYEPFVGAEFGFVYPQVPDFAHGNDVKLVDIQTGFGAGWFTCENQVLNATAYSPATPAQYPQSCEQNGIVGKVVYNELDRYYFNAVDVQSFATQDAVAHCSALYEPVVKKVSKLPPYSCTRTLHPGFFSCLATAFANTTFLMQLMIFCFALMLPKLAGRFPVLDNTVGADVEKEIGVEMHSVHDVDVESPMQ